MYCVKCKRKTDTIHLRNEMTKNHRNILKGLATLAERLRTNLFLQQKEAT